MKPRVAQAIIAAMACVIAALAWTLVYYARDEWGLGEPAYEEEIDSASNATQIDGRPVVRLSAASQLVSGIVLRPLEAAASEESVEAYGVVVNIQTLLDSRGRYLVALGETRARRAALAAGEAEFKRMQLLFRDDRNVSEQALRNAEARFRSESAQLAAAEAALGALDNALRSAWGDVVAGWAKNPDPAMLKALLEQRAHLVVIAFPFDLPANALRAAVSVAPVTARDRLRPARHVSEAPQVEALLPGQTFFYLVEGADLRAGTRIVAHANAGGDRQRGVLLPREAVVWHAGKSWAYVKQDEETFGRYAVRANRELGSGWFNPEGELKPGDEVVVSGAQLLLSEELKFQIRNENED
jgi:multidrug efflux pump subunit AcrA (membrane-fusion protein)